MANVGNLFIKIGADHSGLQSSLKLSTDMITKFGKDITNLGVTAVKSTAVISEAFAGMAVAISTKSLKAFSDFDTGMREVFTIIPNLTEDAMSKMSSRVKDFSQDFGKLPKEVIPALYEAISSGVSADNVFSFMETAQKSAIGGVTDVMTSVDGLTTVLNSYGMKTSEVTKVSDAMFIAVKLGKTTFDELSKFLYEVTPIASATGISFNTISAALATMTAQGVPTRIAGTQLKYMITELGDSTSTTAKSFKLLSGQSFGEFVSKGGTLVNALAIMEQGAKNGNKKINEMFSSIEAGNGALTLTGKSSELFVAALNEMENAAGSTDKAYAIMADGFKTSFNKVLTTVNVKMIELGDKLAPSAKEAMAGFLDVMSGSDGGNEKIKSGVDSLVNTFMSEALTTLPTIVTTGDAIISAFVNGIVNNKQSIVESADIMIDGFIDTVTKNSVGVADLGMTLLNTFTSSIKENFPEIETTAIETMQVLINGLLDSTKDLAPMAKTVVTDLAKFIVDNAPQIITVGGDLIGGIVEGLAASIPIIVEQADVIVESIINSFAKVDWVQVGSDIIGGIATGIGNILQESETKRKLMENAGVSFDNMTGLPINDNALKNYTDSLANKEVTNNRPIIPRNKNKVQTLDEIVNSKITKGIIKSNAVDAMDDIKNYNREIAKEMGKTVAVTQKGLNDVKSKITGTGIVPPKAKTSVDAVTAAFNKLGDSIASQIDKFANFTGLFDIFARKLSTPTSLLRRLGAQVKAMSQWQSALTVLQNRGVSGQLMENIRGMGPSAVDDVIAMSKMTDTQLSQYKNLFGDKYKIAANQAVIGQGGDIGKYGQQVVLQISGNTIVGTGGMDQLVEKITKELKAKGVKLK